MKGRYTGIFIECKNQKAQLGNISKIVSNLETQASITVDKELSFHNNPDSDIFVFPSGKDEIEFFEWIQGSNSLLLDDLIAHFGLEIGASFSNFSEKKSAVRNALLNMNTPFIKILFDANPDSKINKTEESMCSFSDKCLTIVFDGIRRDTFGMFLKNERLGLLQEMIKLVPISTEMIDMIEKSLDLGDDVISKRFDVMKKVCKNMRVEEAEVIKMKLAKIESEA